MNTWIILVAVALSVAALVGSVAIMFQRDPVSNAEARLSALSPRRSKSEQELTLSALTDALEGSTTWADRLAARFGNLQASLDQAGMTLSPGKFMLICLAVGAVVSGLLFILPFTRVFAIFGVPLGAMVPLFWLKMVRARRMAKFSAQLPEALELLSRSLRSGYSLGAGIGLVAEEVPSPLGPEFGRAFEEQNFGVPLEETLDTMTQRVPNVDLRFFATAVALQRQTGGDLAEILDKLSKLIRERFKLAGTVQALTGEGRLSGVVLLALAPGLFCVMYFLNREYTMVLIDDSTGRKLMAGALVLQFLGALWIKKIINVQV